MADLEFCRTLIPDARSVILTFSLTATFYLAKVGNRTNILSQGTVFAKCLFLVKNADITKRYKLKETYICVRTYLPNFRFLA